MSRTFRRNKQHLIKEWMGTYDEHLHYEYLWRFYQRRYDPDEFFSEENQQTFLREYMERVVNYTRDNRRGRYGVPRWFRNLFTREERRSVRSEIHRCVRGGEWDDFLNFDTPNQAKWYWF